MATAVLTPAVAGSPNASAAAERPPAQERAACRARFEALSTDCLGGARVLICLPVALGSPPMSLWTDFGFRENPYSAKQLPPTEEGERMLVGRDEELRRLKRILTSTESHPTVEGDNG